MEMFFPEIQQTGEIATLTATCRESQTVPATANIRLSLPRRTLVITTNDSSAVTLPQSGLPEGGLAVAQWRVVLN